jgi:hypothetical protein
MLALYADQKHELGDSAASAILSEQMYRVQKLKLMVSAFSESLQVEVHCESHLHQPAVAVVPLAD